MSLTNLRIETHSRPSGVLVAVDNQWWVVDGAKVWSWQITTKRWTFANWLMMAERERIFREVSRKIERAEQRQAVAHA